MRLKPTYFAIAAGTCGVIALILAKDTPTAVAAAGAAAGFSASVGLLGVAAALVERPAKGP